MTTEDYASLEPEVDLEKEYEEYVEQDPVFGELIDRHVGIRVARHYYTLGLYARQGKQPTFNWEAYRRDETRDPVFGKLIHRVVMIVVASHFYKRGFNAKQDKQPTVDWEAYRREVAKEVLAGLCANTKDYESTYENMAKSAIALADELISNLKKNHCNNL